MRTWRLVRHVINALTGISLFGVIVGLLGRGRANWSAAHGLLVFMHCKIPFRWASAMTFGDVVVVLAPAERWPSMSDIPPALLAHEERHAWQYLLTLGLPYFPLYWLACGVSWVIAGDHWSFNPFEVGAGLSEGGYQKSMSRRARRRAIDSQRSI